ncbi:MAG TPA: hypothetical protein VFE33_25950 [Thermoanaerobaculia bacterium]|nr:hypothetical protein [Thermoanaerobaculia bacterium]
MDTHTNTEILTFLDNWSREPDDKGEEWWAAFEEELERNREFRERETEHDA